MAIQDEIPRSRLTLTYRTTISGEMQEITLPFRFLVLAADLTLAPGTWALDAMTGGHADSDYPGGRYLQGLLDDGVAALID